MSNKKNNIAADEIAMLAREIGRPMPAELKARIMAAVDQIDRDTLAGKIAPVTTKEIAREPKKPEGRDGIE
jgi:hypothetical protein